MTMDLNAINKLIREKLNTAHFQWRKSKLSTLFFFNLTLKAPEMKTVEFAESTNPDVRQLEMSSSGFTLLAL